MSDGEGGAPHQIMVRIDDTGDWRVFARKIAEAVFHSGGSLILITSRVPPEDIVDIGDNKADSFRIVDWYSYTVTRVIGVESEGPVLKCARDTLNVRMALNKVLRDWKGRGDIYIVSDIIPAALQIFDGEDLVIELVNGLSSRAKAAGAIEIHAVDKTLAIAGPKLKGILPNPILPEEALDALGLDPPVLEFLLGITGIGRTKVALLENAGITTLEQLRDAPEEELAAIKGVGSTLASKIKEAVRVKEREADGGGLYLCPKCGGFMASDADICPSCGADLEALEEEEFPGEDLSIGTGEGDGFWYKQQGGLFLCPNCGAFTSEGAERCPLCGTDLEDEEELPTQEEAFEDAFLEAAIPEEDEEADGFWDKDDKPSIYLCPECGAFIGKSSASCSACGAEFGDEEEELTEEEYEEAVGKAEAPPPGMSDGFWYKDDEIGAEDRLRRALGSWEPTKPLDIEEEPRASIYLCPECGALTSADAEECSICGARLVEEAGPVEEESLLDMAKRIEAKREEAETGFEDEFARAIEEESLLGVAKKLVEEAATPEEITEEAVLAAELEAELARPVAPSVEEEEEEEIRALLEEAAAEREEPGIVIDIPIERPAPREGLPEPAGEARQPAPAPVEDITLEEALEPVEAEEVLGPGQPEPIQAGEPPEDIWEEEPEPGPEPEEEEVIGPPPREIMDRIKEVEAGIEIHDSLTRSLIRMGALMLRLGRWNEAVAFYEEATAQARGELEPVEAEVEIPIAPFADEPEGPPPMRDDVKLSLRRIDTMLERDPEQPRFWRKKGELLESAGRPREAREAYAMASSLESRLMGTTTPSRVRGGLFGKKRETRGLVNGLTNGLGRGRVNGLGQGRVNGLTNGRVNGLTNGRSRRVGMINGRREGWSNGLVNGRGRVNGLTNGLVNGRGRVNGLTNGLTNGRGRVNGLTNGLGMRYRGPAAAPGLFVSYVDDGGLLDDTGLVNGRGLINGNGLVNGMGLLVRPRIMQPPPFAKERIAAMLLVLIIVFSTAFVIAYDPDAGADLIVIDGSFRDWMEIPGYSDGTSDQVLDPDINILEYKLDSRNGQHSFYVRTEGHVMRGGEDGVNSVHVMIDADMNPDTGYKVKDMGADNRIEIYGWDDDIHTATMYTFNDSWGGNDWNAFSGPIRIDAEVDGGEMEFQVHETEFHNGFPGRLHALVIAANSHGEMDLGDLIVDFVPGAMKVVQSTIASGTVQPGEQDVPMLKLAITASDKLVTIGGLTLSAYGTVEDRDIHTVKLFHDTDGSGGLSHGDELLSQISEFSETGVPLRFDAPLRIARGEQEVLIATMDLSHLAHPGRAVGLRLSGPEALDTDDGPITLDSSIGSNAYIGQTPPSIRIDGAFDDWSPTLMSGDPNNDVGGGMNENVDISQHASVVQGLNLSFFTSVDGRMMGGVCVPRSYTRSTPALEDSDGDGIPNIYDEFPSDFDDDGTPDSADGDSDNDGVLDYPGGDDNWLERPDTGAQRYVGPALPPDSDGDFIDDYNDSYPNDFDNDAIPDENDQDKDNDDEIDYDVGGEDVWLQNVDTGAFKYIGPVAEKPHVPRTGDDTMLIYIDSDADMMSGFRRGRIIVGADYVLQITGREGEVHNSSLFRFNGSYQAVGDWLLTDWDVPVALDDSRLESQVSVLDVNLGSRYRVQFYIEDWTEHSDIGDTIPFFSRGPSSKDLVGTRTVTTINVTDNSTADWDGVGTTFLDGVGESSIDGTDLTLLSVANDDEYLYLRWDVVDTGSWNKPAILFDIGINRTGTGTTIDVWCAAHIEKSQQYPPYLINISIRTRDGNKETYIWNSTDDGPSIDDGRLIMNAYPGNHSTEARFPLSILNLAKEFFIGSFEAHASESVSSASKDICPDDAYFKYNTTTGGGGEVTDPNATIPASLQASKSANGTTFMRGEDFQWRIYFSNVGENTSNVTWLNETLPFGTTFVDDNSTQLAIDYSGSAANVSRNIVGWTSEGYEIQYSFYNVTVANYTFVINCTVNSTAETGTWVTNNLTFHWEENPGYTRFANASVYISPFRVEKNANVSVAYTGGAVGWTIWFNNTGDSTLDTVWLNETLPFNMTYVSDNATQHAIGYSGEAANLTRSITGWTADGYGITYEFRNVTPGVHVFVVNTTVNSSATPQYLNNSVSLEWGEPDINSLANASVTSAEIPEFSDMVLPVMALIITFIVIKRKKKEEESNEQGMEGM